MYVYIRVHNDPQHAVNVCILSSLYVFEDASVCVCRCLVCRGPSTVCGGTQSKVFIYENGPLLIYERAPVERTHGMPKLAFVRWLRPKLVSVRRRIFVFFCLSLVRALFTRRGSMLLDRCASLMVYIYSCVRRAAPERNHHHHRQQQQYHHHRYHPLQHFITPRRM